MTDAAPSTLRRDLLAAYVAAGAKVGSWAVVSAVAFRLYGADVLAMLALARGTLGLLNYVTLGLGPALLHSLAHSNNRLGAMKADDAVRVDELPNVYAHGWMAGFVAVIAGGLALWVYSKTFGSLHVVPRFFQNESLPYFIMGLGGGMLTRLLGDVPGAVLQIKHRQAVDQTIVALGDFLWLGFLAIILLIKRDEKPAEFLATVGRCYFASGAAALFLRATFAAFHTGRISNVKTSYSLLNQMLAYGLLLTLAQLADFLYAPTDMILINRLISPEAVATYTPAIQIDAALLLLVGGLANVMLPRAALAHAAGDVERLKRDYVRGTLVSFTMLVAGAIFVWLIAPVLFKVWFNDPLPATQAILPLVLVHTVVGGSSAVGRSILLGMGRVRAFTAAALVAGAMNVVLSYCFVTFFDLGLSGIVLGTIVVVVGRCAVWMPWYVWRTLGRVQATETSEFNPQTD